MRHKELVLILFLAALLLVSGCSMYSPSGQFIADANNSYLQAKCSDSDLGKDIYAKGTITAILPDGSKYVDEDVCVFGLLIEQFCSGGLPFSENLRCDRGCENGICKK